jgi:hypothetical protein
VRSTLATSREVVNGGAARDGQLCFVVTWCSSTAATDHGRASGEIVVHVRLIFCRAASLLKKCLHFCANPAIEGIGAIY